MNKTLAITTIALIAVVMGMSAVVPAMADAPSKKLGCPPSNDHILWVLDGRSFNHEADHNGDRVVCQQVLKNQHDLWYFTGLAIDNTVPQTLRI